MNQMTFTIFKEKLRFNNKQRGKDVAITPFLPSWVTKSVFRIRSNPKKEKKLNVLFVVYLDDIKVNEGSQPYYDIGLRVQVVRFSVSSVQHKSYRINPK